uniref:mitogen-activated protein kinase kinase n=1 Tax=Cacopsylla melanoneura TaxID=428564 RepID=A0A8D8URX9_9HEMI
MDRLDNAHTMLNELEARMRKEKLGELNERENITLAPPRTNGTARTPQRLNGMGTKERPKMLGDIGTPTRTRRQTSDIPGCNIQQPKQIDSLEIENKMKEIMKMNGILNINNRRYQTEMKHLEHMGELGSGTCGQVVKMLHKPSQTVIAVKQMRRSGNGEENKRIIMDLDVVLKSSNCENIVRCLGCFITESDVWICMELMATCFDRLLKRLRISVPEPICGKITLSTVRALHYLKESHGVIHRDVKPSNILLDERGKIKLCDFGISGRLVDSKARTKNAGCAAYMAPERIEPPDPRKPDYDIRADVWSLGITLVELATGEFPYKDCSCDFAILSRVLKEDPPSLPNDPTRFSPEFQNFVSLCLTKDYQHRPKYRKLLEHPFLRRYENLYVDVAEWYRKVVETSNVSTGVSSPALSVRNSTNGRPSGVSLSSPQPFRRNRMQHAPDLQHAYYRSASVSPNRYYVPSEATCTSSKQSEEHSNARQNIKAFIKRLGGTGGNATPPSPPPRHREAASSPRLFRRMSSEHHNQSYPTTQPSSSNSNYHPTNPFVQYSSSNPFTPLPLHRNPLDASPYLPRKHNVCPSPPMPPPRRLSESVPPTPVTLRAKYNSYTPEPSRRTLNQDL